MVQRESNFGFHELRKQPLLVARYLVIVVKNRPERSVMAERRRLNAHGIYGDAGVVSRLQVSPRRIKILQPGLDAGYEARNDIRARTEDLVDATRKFARVRGNFGRSFLETSEYLAQEIGLACVRLSCADRNLLRLRSGAIELPELADHAANPWRQLAVPALPRFLQFDLKTRQSDLLQVSDEFFGLRFQSRREFAHDASYPFRSRRLRRNPEARRIVALPYIADHFLDGHSRSRVFRLQRHASAIVRHVWLYLGDASEPRDFFLAGLDQERIIAEIDQDRVIRLKFGRRAFQVQAIVAIGVE